MDTDHDHLLGHHCRAPRRVVSRPRYRPHSTVGSAVKERAVVILTAGDVGECNVEICALR